MSNMSGRSRFPVDAALILSQLSVPITATKNLALQQLVTTGAWWQSPADVKDGTIYLVGTAGPFGGTGVTLAVQIFTADANGANSVLFGSFPVLAGQDFELPIDQVSLLKANPLGVTWYATLAVAGTSPSIPVFAYLAPRSPI